jgi:hypothetical protein
MAEVKGVLGPAPADAGPGALQDIESPGTEGGDMGRKTLIAGFATEKDLLDAVASVKKHGWPITEAHTPHAVHGLDRALGLPRCWLSVACCLGGVFGIALSLGFQFWSTAKNWPLNVGGQPWRSLPAFVPVMFESMVLCAGLGMILAWLLRSGLYPGKEPVLPLRGETDDRFVLILGPRLPVDDAEVAKLLRDHRAVFLQVREGERELSLGGR